MPIINRSVEHSMSRYLYIKVGLDNPTRKKPEVILLGNSAMSIDGNELTQGLSEQPLVRNFGATGQSFIEVRLYFKVIPNSTKKILLVSVKGILFTSREEVELGKKL